MKVRVIYHANCNDGLAAAAVTYLQFGQAEMLPAHYGDAPPPAPEDETDLYIVDFSYPHKTICELALQYRNVVVIDHHKTAAADLLDKAYPDNVELIFDQEHCGAYLTWEYFFKSYETPIAIRLVEDRDLWQWRLLDSKAFSYGVRLNLDSPQAFAPLLQVNSKGLLTRLISDGKVLARHYDKRAKEEAEFCTPDTWCKVRGHVVPLLNLTENISETLHEVLKAWPDAPFAVSYFDIPHERKRVYSFRSTDDRLDVSEIARAMGGGGHRNAAGAAVMR